MSTADPPEVDLPKSLLKRLIKTKLQEVDKSKGGEGTRDFQVNKDALLAFGEAAKLFIHYLTAAANDNCKDAKRQTISAEDVMTALNDLEFGDFVEPLKHALEAFKVENREKNAKKAAASKKRKTEAPPAGGAAAAMAEAEEGMEGGEGLEDAEADKRQRGEVEDGGDVQPMEAEEEALPE